MCYWHYDELDPDYGTEQFAVVEIVDDLTVSLRDGTKFIFFRDMKPRHTVHSVFTDRLLPAAYRPTRRNSVSIDSSLFRIAPPDLVSTNEKRVVNPKDGAVFIGTDEVQVSMISTIPRQQLHAWQMFTHSRLEYDIDYKSRPHVKENKHILQRWNLRLRDGFDFGHLQLMVGASELKVQNNAYPQGKLRTFFFFSNSKQFQDKSIYPPMICVVPQARQTYVPLEVGQIMQIVLSDAIRLEPDASLQRHAIRRFKDEIACTNKHVCVYYRCEARPQTIEPIFFALKNPPSGPGVIIVPTIELIQGEPYVVLQNPMSEFTLYCNGIKGFILRSQDAKVTTVGHRTGEWLDRKYQLRIESRITWTQAEESAPHYDVRVRLLQKSKMTLNIKKLYDPNGCEAS